MDALGIARCALFGWSEGGTIALAFTARHPERVSRLIVFGAFARSLAAPDYPQGGDPERAAALTTLVRSEWGTGSRILTNVFLPEVDDHLAAWFTRWQRVGLTPAAAARSREANAAVDIRSLLPTIAVPTLVIERRGDFLDAGKSRYIAAHLPNVRFVSLDGEHHVPFLGDWWPITDAIEAFLADTPEAPAVPSAPRDTPLTRREVEVLRLVTEGLPNRAIALRLAVSEKTVNRHLVNLYAKLGVNSRGAAIAHAFRQGYVPL
jgi:pimeloyl-ACP methyl ester carboxylesterase/DNA-binding CsgD family transcriptional regulator